MSAAASTDTKKAKTYKYWDPKQDYGWQQIVSRYLPNIPKDTIGCHSAVEKAYDEIQTELFTTHRPKLPKMNIANDDKSIDLTIDFADMYVDDLVALLAMLCFTNRLSFDLLRTIGNHIYGKFTTGIPQQALNSLFQHVWKYKTEYSDKRLLLLISWGARMK